MKRGAKIAIGVGVAAALVGGVALVLVFKGAAEDAAKGIGEAAGKGPLTPIPVPPPPPKPPPSSLLLSGGGTGADFLFLVVQHPDGIWRPWQDVPLVVVGWAPRHSLCVSLAQWCALAAGPCGGFAPNTPAPALPAAIWSLSELRWIFVGRFDDAFLFLNPGGSSNPCP